MSKLIELLNEYEKEIKKSVFDEWEKGIGGDTNLFRRDIRDPEGSHIYSDTADTYVISKKFGFIKWLVDNDKIELPTSCAIDKNNDYDEREIKSDYESLLMLLAIQDEPIQFLCDILK